MHGSQDSGVTLIELLIALAIIGLIAAVAVPSVARAKMSANEASAVASLKVIGLGELEYSASCGNDGFAVSFVVLASAPSGAGAPFIPPDLSTSVPRKAGYAFTLAPGAGADDGPADCRGAVTQTAYLASATPIEFGATGGWSYAINAGNLVWQVPAAVAPSEPFGPPAVPAR